jgi:pSer/pThr/pTyr-binding forkhead associated (FHA) protein
MAAPGQPSVCFSCGQPLAPQGGVAHGAPPPAAAGAATIRGAAGHFTIRAGSEMRVGRDPAQCPIFLSEPRVSGVHATLRFDGGQLLVRDETSNNGTWVAGSRIAPGSWTPVPMGTPLRFGPVEFTAQPEA